MTPDDGDPRHGSANGYVNLGCRCTPCRGAWADYYDQHRKRPRELAADDPRHGTENGYRWWHCKCRKCLDAHSKKRAGQARTRRARGN